jgi:siderophore synthetase component
MRTISPQSAHNGPLVSGILREVQQRERGFGGKFLITEERAGVYYDPSDESLTREERTTLNKNLVAIFRENLEDHVGADETAMPGSALLAESPLSGKPIALELIEQFAQEQGILSLEEAALRWIELYAEMALPGFLTIMSRYGISLEGHLQNSVPVFRNGSPVRMILRDFGGVRMLRERLAKQGLLRDFLAGSITIKDDLQDVRAKIFYPVFQNHLGELITTIVRALGIEEERLWRPVAEVSRAVYAELKRDERIAQQAAEDEAALFAERIDLKAMTTMRLLGEFTTYAFAEVPNPLWVLEKTYS